MNADNGKVVETGEGEFAIHGGDAVSRSIVPVEGRSRTGRGANADYTFTMEAKGENGPWEVRRLDWKPAAGTAAMSLTDAIGGRPLGRREDPYVMVASYVCGGLIIDNTWFPYLVNCQTSAS